MHYTHEVGEWGWLLHFMPLFLLTFKFQQHHDWAIRVREGRECESMCDWCCSTVQFSVVYMLNLLWISNCCDMAILPLPQSISYLCVFSPLCIIISSYILLYSISLFSLACQTCFPQSVLFSFSVFLKRISLRWHQEDSSRAPLGALPITCFLSYLFQGKWLPAVFKHTILYCQIRAKHFKSIERWDDFFAGFIGNIQACTLCFLPTMTLLVIFMHFQWSSEQRNQILTCSNLCLIQSVLPDAPLSGHIISTHDCTFHFSLLLLCSSNRVCLAQVILCFILEKDISCGLDGCTGNWPRSSHNSGFSSHFLMASQSS